MFRTIHCLILIAKCRHRLSRGVSWFMRDMPDWFVDHVASLRDRSHADDPSTSCPLVLEAIAESTTRKLKLDTGRGD